MVRTVHVDPAHLTTAISQLLSNAFDAMPDGGDVLVRTSRLTVDPHGMVDCRILIRGLCATLRARPCFRDAAGTLGACVRTILLN